MKPKIRLVPINRIVLDEMNANKGTKRGRELLEESLDKYGAGRSVVLDCPSRLFGVHSTGARAEGGRDANYRMRFARSPLTLVCAEVEDGAILSVEVGLCLNPRLLVRLHGGRYSC